MPGETQNIVVLARSAGKRISFCKDCTKATGCPAFAAGVSATSVNSSSPLQKNVRDGQTVLETGDAFTGIYLVKSGFFKSSFIDIGGELQVTGYYFPGEMFGFDGMERGRHGTMIESLGSGSVCKIPLALAADHPGAVWNASALVALLRIASDSINREREMMYALGKMSARRRFAMFLLDMSGRMGRSGYNPETFRLFMSRNDIANYLCLAVETVSRLFTQFQSRGIIHVDRRDLQIRDRRSLEVAAGHEGDAEMLFEKAS